MNYFLPAALRDALLEYMEEKEAIEDYAGINGVINLPNDEYVLAAQLRDLKPLREVSKEAA